MLRFLITGPIYDWTNLKPIYYWTNWKPKSMIPLMGYRAKPIISSRWSVWWSFRIKYFPRLSNCYLRTSTVHAKVTSNRDQFSPCFSHIEFVSGVGPSTIAMNCEVCQLKELVSLLSRRDYELVSLCL